jgi:hypothetical protein
MTESEWLTCDDPQAMLEQVRQTASQRKLRWFACACVRSVWHHLLDESSQRAVEVSERYADGNATASELADAEVAAFEVARVADLRTTVSDPGWAATRAAARSANSDSYTAGGSSFFVALCFAPWSFQHGQVYRGDPVAKSAARRRQCDLLLDILGNPFRVSVIHPDWLAWNEGTVTRLATHIYEGRRFDEMTILGDALEDAGCDNADILDHCRSGSEHVRGCWVVDLILGKE